MAIAIARSSVTQSASLVLLVASDNSACCDARAISKTERCVTRKEASDYISIAPGHATKPLTISHDTGTWEFIVELAYRISGAAKLSKWAAERLRTAWSTLHPAPGHNEKLGTADPRSALHMRFHQQTTKPAMSYLHGYTHPSCYPRLLPYLIPRLITKAFGNRTRSAARTANARVSNADVKPADRLSALRALCMVWHGSSISLVQSG